MTGARDLDPVGRLLGHVVVGGAALAFDDGKERRSWTGLRDAARARAAWLEEWGVRPGDRVATLLPRSLAAVELLVATWWLGAVAVPVNPGYGTAELDHLLGDCAPRLLIVGGGLPSGTPVPAGTRVVGLGERALPAGRAAEVGGLIPPVPALEPDEPALLIYTSGTTGPSKGVIHTARTVATAIGELTGGWRFGPADRIALALPLFHVHGLGIGIVGTLIHGGRATLLSRFSAEAVAEAIEDGCTVFLGVPTMYSALLGWLEQDPGRGSRLAKARLFASGSAALPAAHLLRFEELTGHRILERYGMSETLLTLSNPYEGPRQAGRVGRPVGSMQARVVGEDGEPVGDGVLGELQVAGPFVMTGYWGKPGAFAAAFHGPWFRTGDLARRGPDGTYELLGRKSSDFMKTGGFRVATREVEDVLREHPAVAEIAVFGVPDPHWGEIVAAAVVRTPHGTVEGSMPEETGEASGVEQEAEGLGVDGTPDGEATAGDEDGELLAELQAWSRGRLADHKLVRALRIVDELPRNALGKLQKNRLASLFEEGAAAVVGER